MSARNPGKVALSQHGNLQDMYPDIWEAYRRTYGKDPLSPEVWGFLHDLHFLQSAQDEPSINDVIWTLSILVAAMKKPETKKSAEVGKALVRAIPTREHQEWYSSCQREGQMEAILQGHPDSKMAARDPGQATRTALAIGVLLYDFQTRWSTLAPWQREFMHKEVGVRCGEVLRDAQEVADVMNKRSFTFMFARQLIRTGECSTALKLIQSAPVQELGQTVECGDPPQKHSYFELYTQLLVYGDASDLFTFLEHFVRTGAYSDVSLATFFKHEELKEVVSFVIHFVSCVRRQQFGLNGGPDTEDSSGRSCCAMFKKRSAPPVALPLRTSNVPHVLLVGLLDKYETQDMAGRDQLLHDKTFLQAFEVVLLLSESEVVVRMADRLSNSHQEALKRCLRDWSRLHFLRVLERNMPPAFDANAAEVLNLIAGGALWTWTPSEKRSHYFKSASRSSEDIAVVLCIFFELSMFLDPAILKQVLADGQTRHPPINLLDDFLPENSSLFDAIAGEVGRHATGLTPVEAKMLMRSPGFYEPGIQGFLRGKAADAPRAVFHEKTVFVRLLQVVAKLSGFRNGKMDTKSLESSLGQIATACHGDSNCLELVVEVINATLKKPESEFRPPGTDDLDSDHSAFTVASLAVCAKRLREACDTVRNQTVQVTFGKVVSAFLDTPPRGWVPLFNSLETVLFFLRFMEREDLDLAYSKFEADNAEDKNMRRLLDRAKKYYKEPFIDLEKDATDLCNLDLRTKMSRKLLPAKKRSTDDMKFDNGDWNTVVEIALCAAESMKEKYNIPMLPHHTQMITLLMFAIQVCQGPGSQSMPKTILAKVGTGEGKSWIIGMLAAFVAKRGLRAHVVIDNDTLLERDFATMSNLFKKMKLTADKRKLDQGLQIVYCSAMDIEIHCLRSMQDCAKDFTLKGSVMIVDEVDSLIVDDNVYTCYVDYYPAGSEICEWWFDQGRHENAWNHQPWRRKIMDTLVAADRDLKSKKENKDFIADHNMGTFWALDERTSHVKRNAWFLWLELLRKQRLNNYTMRYNTRQSVLCKQSCFSSYSYIFGLTGSLGTEAEKRYTKKQFGASNIMVPNFLDTCKGQSRPRPKCILMQMEGNAQKQLDRTVATARDHCSDVPILVVVRDPDRVEKVVNELRAKLPNHLEGDRLGPGVVELLDKPGQEGDFQQMVEIATQPLELQQLGKNEIRYWRVTVTTAVGARGQDYHISDELVDEKGGFLLILEYVPDSEREWIQFLGRTARHDHPGQYAVVLNVEDYRDVFGFEGAADKSYVRPILDYYNRQNEQKLQDSEIQIERGKLMHRYTQQWWLWAKEHQNDDPEELQERFMQWVELCEKFETQSPDEITKVFTELDFATVGFNAADSGTWEQPNNDFEEEHATRVRQEPEKGRRDVRRDSESKTQESDRSTRATTTRSSADPDVPEASDDDFADIFRRRTPRKEADMRSVVSGQSCMRRKNGEGRRILPDGRLYNGQFVHGKMTGEGQMQWPSGQVYNGQFSDDVMTGTGTMKWTDGSSYSGQWEQGKQHGTGTFNDKQGSTWTGQWRAGNRVKEDGSSGSDA